MRERKKKKKVHVLKNEDEKNKKNKKKRVLFKELSHLKKREKQCLRAEEEEEDYISSMVEIGCMNMVGEGSLSFVDGNPEQCINKPSADVSIRGFQTVHSQRRTAYGGSYVHPFLLQEYFTDPFDILALAF